MKAVGRLIMVVLVMVVALAALATVALASEGGEEAPRRIKTGSVVEFGEARPLGGTGADGHEEKVEGPEKQGEKEAEAEGHEPAWMIPGWQSIFAALAVAYYALAVFVLPKIMARSEEHH